MVITDLTTLKINELTKAQYNTALEAGTISENELYATPEEDVDLSKFMVKPTITTATLLASNWDSTAKTYSFEATYPSARYDIEIDFDYDNGTSEQYEAYGAAQLGGSATSNKVKAMGDVPTIDIPIVVYVTAK